jgi:hypothetical protein
MARRFTVTAWDTCNGCEGTGRRTWGTQKGCWCSSCQGKGEVPVEVPFSEALAGSGLVAVSTADALLISAAREMERRGEALRRLENGSFPVAAASGYEESVGADELRGFPGPREEDR